MLRSDTPSNIAGALAGSFDDLTRGIGDVLTREQLAIVMDGKATDAQLDAVMRAVDLNGDGVMSGLESVIIKSMPTDATLANALQNQLEANGNKALTAAQVRQALSPIASNERINQLIDRIDVNGDGLLSAQEITSARIGGLSGSIAQSLSGYFDELDANLDGKLTFAELKDGLDGMATNSQLRAMMRASDINADGVISGLEAVVIKSMPSDSRLATVLRNQLHATRTRQLTHAQIREALNSIAPPTPSCGP
ncbi:EF-hand domain-containing protein [Halomonas elongata]|uniref:EF-hand domain-containing protein n=1 Tax=Halomonas elongata TaxID=2746 RepID=UPI002E2DE69C|nr:EF-hand domain-containing protein [Halomonas elongata]WVI71417.1 EF-hand domain-containing protein [Halomonas elongata]